MTYNETARLAPVKRQLEAARRSYQTLSGMSRSPNVNKLIEARKAKGEKSFA